MYPSSFDGFSIQPKRIPSTFLADLLATVSLRFNLYENVFRFAFCFFLRIVLLGIEFGVAVVSVSFGLF